MNTTEQLIDIAVNLQKEAIRFRKLLDGIPSSKMNIPISAFSDVAEEIGIASGEVTDMIFQLNCGESGKNATFVADN